jgi:tetratricopeptide (TPR) repeat protein
LPIYERHLAAHPDDATVRRRLVNGLMALHRDRDALPHARLMYDAGHGLAEGRVLAGIYLRLHQPGRASEVAIDLRRRSPGDLEVAEFAVTLLLRLREFDAAVAEAGRFAAEAPESFAAHLLQAMALQGAGRDDEAQAALARAEAAAPDSADSYFALGRAYFAVSNYARAETLFTRALTLGADTAAAWYEIAGARERGADVDGAEAAIRQVVERRPDSAQALNFLGYLYADYNRNLPEAVRLIRRALELDPHNGFIMDSLGWAYFRMGDLDSARVELERALATSGDDPTILEHLGDVLVALDRPAAAGEKYRRALELGPEHPDDLREKLRRLR